MCLSLQSRLHIAQTYAALVEQETGRPFPSLEDCQRIAALFGKTLSAPEGELPEQIEKLMQQFVSQQAPLLFPFFAQFGSMNLLPQHDPIFFRKFTQKLESDAISFCKFRETLDAVDWEKPLLPQFSALEIGLIFLDKITNMRNFNFQAMMEIKQRTVLLPPEKKRQCLMILLFYHLSHFEDTTLNRLNIISIFTSFGMLKKGPWQEQILSSGLSEEDLICFSTNWISANISTGCPQIIRWIKAWPVSSKGQVKMTIAFLERLNHYRLRLLGPNGMNDLVSALSFFDPSQNYLLLKGLIERLNWIDLKAFKDLALDESQWWKLALHLVEKQGFSRFLSQKAYFPAFEEEKYAEMIFRFAESADNINSMAKNLNISNETLLWKLFLAGSSKDLKCFSFGMGIRFWFSSWDIPFSNSNQRQFLEILKKIGIALNEIPQQKAQFSDILDSLKKSDFVVQWGIETVLDPHLKAIEAMNGGEHSLKALLWLLNLMGRCMDQEIPLPEALAYPFIENALKLHHPQMRENLLPKIISFLTDSRQRAYADAQLAQLSQFFKYAQLPIFFVSLLLGTEGAPQELCDSLIALSKNRVFKNAQHLKAYLTVLMLILEEKSWLQEDKNYLLGLIVSRAFPPDSTPKDVSKESGNADISPQKSGPSSIEKAEIEKQIKAALSLLQALPSAASLAGVSALKRENLIAFNGDVEQVFAEAFGKEIPIQQVDLHKQFHNELNKMFRVENALLIYAGTIKKYLYGCEEWNTMKAAFASFVDALLIDLKDPKPNAFRKMRYSLERSTHLKEVFSKDEGLFAKWQENIKLPLKPFIKTHFPYIEEEKLSFCNDWTIEFTDDPVDLFLCGTETPSCQNINGYLEDSLCLLALLVDGKNKLVAIKTKEGKLVGRHLLRILLNEHSETLLYLEPLYDQAAFRKDILKGVLEEFTRQIAKKMELPLLFYNRYSASGNEEEVKKYPGKIFSLGSSVPCEYTDGGKDGHGMRTDGHFEIGYAHFPIF